MFAGLVAKMRTAFGTAGGEAWAGDSPTSSRPIG
jgi:hypothetical protein